MKNLLSISKEVQHALDHNLPVVALESTIISHGMPYPQNVEMAKTVEQIIRDNGAVPATIAIMDGQFKIGLEEADLERLASEKPVANQASTNSAAGRFPKRLMDSSSLTTSQLTPLKSSGKWLILGPLTGIMASGMDSAFAS